MSWRAISSFFGWRSRRRSRADPRQRPLIFLYQTASGRQSVRHVSNWTEDGPHIVGDDVDARPGEVRVRRKPKRRTFRKDRIVMWANTDWNQLDSYRLGRKLPKPPQKCD